MQKDIPVAMNFPQQAQCKRVRCAQDQYVLFWF